jgi:predicted porin
MNVRRAVFACASALGLTLASQGAGAFGMMDVGEWKVEFSGNVNGFLSNVDCTSDAAGPVLAGLACGSLSGGDYKDTNIRTGLLPSWLGFHAERTEGSTKYGITIGFQPGIDSNTRIAGAPIDGGLGLNSSNFRQVFLEFSGGWGGIKVGRDLGIFGSDAILSDMTLLGVGTVSDLARGGGNTTLGRIGVGYVYADWKGQIQYSSPKFGGFSFNIAVVDPWGLVNLSGVSADAGTFNQEAPDFLGSNGWEGKLNYAWEGDFNGKVWASFIYQKLDSATPGVGSETADGFDIGFKVGIAGFEGVGYYYTGKGIGTTDFLFDAMDLGGELRDSDGYYAQVTWKIPGPKTKIGVSYGESKLDLNDTAADTAIAGPAGLVEKNKSYVIGIYHPMTSALNLVLEYTDTKAQAHNGNEAEEKAIAVGAILFF